MQNSLFTAIIAILLLSSANVSQAELRDVSFAAEQQTAKMLFTFKGQPDAVKVILNEQGMDVDILGVSASSATISPASSALVSSFRTIPAPKGVRIRLVLRDRVLAASAEVYKNSVLVSAIFPNLVEPPTDALSFVSAPAKSIKPMRVANQSQAKEHQSASHAKTPTAPAKPVKNDDLGDGKINGHDGKKPMKRVPANKPLGSGMIREASMRAAGSLTARQCQQAEMAVKEDPWALDNLARFGSCLAVEGKAKEARQVFERLLTFDPETFAAYVGLGAIAQDAGEKETARQYYEEALSLGGTDAQAAQVRSLLRALGSE